MRLWICLYSEEVGTYEIDKMIIPLLTVSSLLGFNASLGQSLDLRGRKTVNQRSIMARVLRLAGDRWSRHIEKREEREGGKGGGEWNLMQSRRSGQGQTERR